MIYVDVEGLGKMAAALALDGEQITDRLHLLAQLRKGAGVTVLTSPRGAPFWSLASLEVEVKVVPDDYVYKERIEDEHEWAYRAVGFSSAETRRLLRRKSPPTEKDRAFAGWHAAQSLLERLPRDVEARVVLDWDYHTLDVDNASRLLTSDRNLLALDWEWDIETQIPFDLGIYDGVVAYHVPILPHEVARIRTAVGDRQRAGRDTIWHGGRADLGKQHDRDPEELLDTPPHDSQIMAYLCGEADLHLKHLTRERLHRQVVEYNGRLQDLDIDHRARYVCADVRNSYDLYHLYDRRLTATGQQSVYNDIERPLMPVIASMERGGVPVDMAALLQMRADTSVVEGALLRYFHDDYGFDVSDDAATLGWLTKLLGHNPGTLDQRVISWYPNPEVDLLLLYRRTRTARRADDKCIALWEGRGRPADFRVYPSFNQAGDPEDGRPAPRSGRLSSSGEINIQQQTREIKPVFVAPEGNLWWDYDYSGIELRVAACVSGEPTMLRALRDGLDMHSLLQDKVQANSGERPPRVMAKRWNFGKLYGAQLDKLIEILASERIFIDRATAQMMDKSTLELFPQYPQWAKNVVRKTGKDDYSQTWYGRRRYIPEIHSDDPKEVAHAANAAINHVVQGSAGDLIKMAMVKLARVARVYSAHEATSVHDAIGGWVPEDKAARWDKTAKAVLSSFRLVDSIPMLVEGGYGRSWGDCHH